MKVLEKDSKKRHGELREDGESQPRAVLENLWVAFWVLLPGLRGRDSESTGIRGQGIWALQVILIGMGAGTWLFSWEWCCLVGVFVKVTIWRGGTCAAGLLRGEIPLSILRCLGRLPTAKNYLAPNVSRTEVGKPWVLEVTKTDELPHQILTLGQVAGWNPHG